MKNFCFVKFWIPPFSDFHMTPLVGISQSVWEFHEMRRDAVLQMFGPLRMPQPPFLKHILPQTFWNDSVTWNTSRKGHPVWGTTYVDITTIHFKLKCSLGLWQLPWERWWWFAFWERGSGYTGEKAIKTFACKGKHFYNSTSGRRRIKRKWRWQLPSDLLDCLHVLCRSHSLDVFVTMMNFAFWWLEGGWVLAWLLQSKTKKYHRRWR